jgi:hypothetical protein
VWNVRLAAHAVPSNLAIRSASLSIASEAFNPSAKGRTALDRAGTDLESGRRLRISTISTKFLRRANVSFVQAVQIERTDVR